MKVSGTVLAKLKGDVMSDDKQPTEHPPMVVWCADMQAGKPVLEALRQGFELDLRVSLPDVGAADTSDVSGDILLLNLSPTESLCRAMTVEDALPSVALQGWLEQARSVLALNRSNRRRVRILDIDMALRHPGAFLRWFGLPEDEAVIAGMSQGSDTPAWDEILQFLAQRALLDDRPSRALLGELEAVSLNFADESDDPAFGGSDAAFERYRKTRRSGQESEHKIELLQAQNRAAQEETEALSRRKIRLEQDLAQANITYAQNQVMQLAMGDLTKGRQQLEQRLEQLGQGIESYQTQVSELDSEVIGLKHKLADKDRVFQEAGEIHRDLEMQTAYLTEALIRARAAQAEKQQQFDVLEDKLRRFMASRFYRLTAPLRRLRAFASRRASN